jgi:hypothetical protein
MNVSLTASLDPCKTQAKIMSLSKTLDRDMGGLYDEHDP